MKVQQKKLNSFQDAANLSLDFTPDLILCFVSPLYKEIAESIKSIREKYPDCILTGCSTSGEILDSSVYDGCVALTAIAFDHTEIRLIHQEVPDGDGSYQVGRDVACNLYTDKLKHIMIFSDGLHVNGAELVKGLRDGIQGPVSMTGGLAGDGSAFSRTFILANDEIAEKRVVGLGFYGDHLHVGYGSKGGWDSFGIERVVTRSHKNILYEIDGQPALQLYKSYLGDKARDLPSSGLLFPLSMRDQESELPVVRTILGIDEEEQSLTFAGDIPEGSYVRLMKANVDRIIDGAQLSARVSNNGNGSGTDFAILISCVGRRLVLKQLVEEEVGAVRNVLGSQTFITGFYSYGEIAPFGEFSPCQLHNQTMTITTFKE